METDLSQNWDERPMFFSSENESPMSLLYLDHLHCQTAKSKFSPPYVSNFALWFAAGTGKTQGASGSASR